jgi:hypothetical protein
MNIAIGDLVGFLRHKAVEIDQPKEITKQKKCPPVSPSDNLWKQLESLEARHKKLKSCGEQQGYSPTTLKSCLAVVLKQQNDILKRIVKRGESKYISPSSNDSNSCCTLPSSDSMKVFEGAMLLFSFISTC